MTQQKTTSNLPQYFINPDGKVNFLFPTSLDSAEAFQHQALEQGVDYEYLYLYLPPQDKINSIRTFLEYKRYNPNTTYIILDPYSLESIEIFSNQYDTPIRFIQARGTQTNVSSEPDEPITPVYEIIPEEELQILYKHYFEPFQDLENKRSDD